MSLRDDLREFKDYQTRLRNGPSPTVCRVMAQFCEKLGHPEEAEQWRKSAEIPKAEGNT